MVKRGLVLIVEMVRWWRYLDPGLSPTEDDV